MTHRFSASLHVYTLREGLLSRLGHDLRLSFDSFVMTSKEGLVTARVALDSLHVDGAMHDGKLDTRQLDAGDRAKITASALGEVLLVKRFAEARFEGKAMSAGFSAASFEGQDSRACVVEALKKAQYPKSKRKATHLIIASSDL